MLTLDKFEEASEKVKEVTLLKMDEEQKKEQEKDHGQR